LPSKMLHVELGEHAQHISGSLSVSTAHVGVHSRQKLAKAPCCCCINHL
jgi:hypothetical protein